jgi:hypothetical protein
MAVTYPQNSCTQDNPPVCTLIQQNFAQGQVVDIIAYDGVSPYTPQSGLELVQEPAGTIVGQQVGD